MVEAPTGDANYPAWPELTKSQAHLLLEVTALPHRAAADRAFVCQIISITREDPLTY